MHLFACVQRISKSVLYHLNILPIASPEPTRPAVMLLSTFPDLFSPDAAAQVLSDELYSHMLLSCLTDQQLLCCRGINGPYYMPPHIRNVVLEE